MQEKAVIEASLMRLVFLCVAAITSVKRTRVRGAKLAALILSFVSNYAEIMLTKVAELYRPLNCALYCRVVVRNFNDVVF